MDLKGKSIVYSFEDLIKDNLTGKFHYNYSKNKRYLDDICTIDTETNQINIEGEKSLATTVTYQVGLNDKVILLRHEYEIINILERLSNEVATKEIRSKSGNKLLRGSTNLVIFIHNLTYDTYMMADWITKHWENQFLVKNKINKFNMYKSLEFRCSSMLTGMSLDTAIREYVPENIRINKTDGWDFKEQRTPYTKLTEDEILYACVDVLALVDVIRELCRIHNRKVGQLPVASTSFTRERALSVTRGVRHSKIKTDANKAYGRLIDTLNLTKEQAVLAHACFVGGITDTNRVIADEIQSNVGDFDVASEYPFVMVSRKFPMSTPIWEDLVEQDLLDMVENTDPDKGFCATILIKELVVNKGTPVPFIVKYKHDEYWDKISLSQDKRIFEAEQILVNVNSIDFKILCEQYTWDNLEVLSCMTFDMDYLPKSLVEFILEGYVHKTEYKNVAGKELDYIISKIVINSIFGVCATNPIMEMREWDDGVFAKIIKTDDELDSLMDKYNKNKNRFTFYLWGIYIAAYGHLILNEGLKIVKDDLIACDTDSVKFRNADKYTIMFEELNKDIEYRLRYISELRNLDWKLFSPKTPEGETKIIGLWDDDGYHRKYGKLIKMVSKRSKCYLKIYENGYDLTTAGISPSATLKYFEELVNKGEYNSIEEAFTSNISIPSNKTKKLSSTYINDQKPFTYKDRDGNEYTANNRFAVLLNDTPFEFTKKDIDKEYYESFIEMSVSL